MRTSGEAPASNSVFPSPLSRNISPHPVEEMVLREAAHTRHPPTPGWLSRASSACPPREPNYLRDKKKGTFGNPTFLGENVKSSGSTKIKNPLFQCVTCSHSKAAYFSRMCAALRLHLLCRNCLVFTPPQYPGPQCRYKGREASRCYSEDPKPQTTGSQDNLELTTATCEPCDHAL